MLRWQCWLGALLLGPLLTSAASAQELGNPRWFRLPPTEVQEVVAPVVDEPLPAPDEKAAEKPADAAETKPEEVPPGEEMLPNNGDWWFMPASWYKPWDGSAELGLNGTEGNSQTFNIRVGAKAKYEQPWVTQTYEVIHVDNSSDGVQTALNGYFDGRIVWPIVVSSRWSYFIHSRSEYDNFRDYDFRISGDTGLGYSVWKTDTSKFDLRSGISTSREIGGSENKFVPELTFGMELNHQIDDRQKISLTSDYYPAVDDLTQDYRINTNASWEIVVSKAWGLSAKLSVIDRYDNTPQGRKPNDINYAALMLWAF